MFFIEIDNLVYQLYELTPEEIEIIEGGKWRLTQEINSEKEYLSGKPFGKDGWKAWDWIGTQVENLLQSKTYALWWLSKITDLQGAW